MNPGWRVNSHPAIAGTVGDTVGWRYGFLGLLPLIALAGALTLGALHAIADVPPPADPARSEARRGRLRLAIAFVGRPSK